MVGFGLVCGMCEIVRVEFEIVCWGGVATPPANSQLAFHYLLTQITKDIFKKIPTPSSLVLDLMGAFADIFEKC